MIAARVELLQGPVAQRPLSQLSMGVTREELDPVTKIWTRGEGLRHGAAEAMPARVVRQPEEMEGIDCLLKLLLLSLSKYNKLGWWNLRRSKG